MALQLASQCPVVSHTYFVRYEVTVMVTAENTISWDVIFTDSSEKYTGFYEMLVVSIRVWMSHPTCFSYGLVHVQDVSLSS